MTRLPVTLADQGIVIEPEDADELTDLLGDAAWVIGSLAGLPAAEDVSQLAPSAPGSCEELAISLRLAAAGLEEAATAGHDNTYIAADFRKPCGAGGKRPRHATEKKHSGEGKR